MPTLRRRARIRPLRESPNTEDPLPPPRALFPVPPKTSDNVPRQQAAYHQVEGQACGVTISVRRSASNSKRRMNHEATKGTKRRLSTLRAAVSPIPLVFFVPSWLIPCSSFRG